MRGESYRAVVLGSCTAFALWIGVIVAVLHTAGISPCRREDRHIKARGGERAELHFLSKMAGKPSGPAAALGESSFIASVSSESLKVMLLRLGVLGESHSGKISSVEMLF